MGLKIRTLLLSFVALIVIVFVANAQVTNNSLAENPPNMIFILTDDAGYDDFGFTGCKDWKTPQIDALAESGIIFRNAYVTASVCGPSRAGLITGRSQQSFGLEENLTGKSIEPVAVEDYGLPLSVPTLGTLLQEKGYTTAAFGKWHLGEYDHFHPNKRGFDYFYGFFGGHRSYWPIKTELKEGPYTLLENEKLRRTPNYLTDQLGKQCAKFISENREKPFFIYLAYNAVHSPLHAKEEDKQALGSITSEARRTLGAMTIALDRSIGLVLDELKKCKLDENTLIVFTNDNGAATYLETNNGGMRGRKGTVWEGGLRVPYFISWPAKIRNGRTATNLVSTLDIATTFCKQAGYSKDEIKRMNLEGSDLLNNQNRNTPLYWKRGNTAAIRLGEWKLISLNGVARFLFNIGKDPNENYNLITNYKTKTEELSTLLLKWMENNPQPIWVKTTAHTYDQHFLKYWEN